MLGQEAPNLILGVLRRIALVPERMTSAVFGRYVIKVMVGILVNLHAQRLASGFTSLSLACMSSHFLAGVQSSLPPISTSSGARNSSVSASRQYG